MVIFHQMIVNNKTISEDMGYKRLYTNIERMTLNIWFSRL